MKMISAQYTDGLELRIKELEAQLAAMTAERDELIGRPIPLSEWQQMEQALAASQAYSAQLREALKVVEQTLTYGQSYTVNAALALPQDDTTLRQWGAKLLREMASCMRGTDGEFLERKADELEKP